MKKTTQFSSLQLREGPKLQNSDISLALKLSEDQVSDTGFIFLMWKVIRITWFCFWVFTVFCKFTDQDTRLNWKYYHCLLLWNIQKRCNIVLWVYSRSVSYVHFLPQLTEQMVHLYPTISESFKIPLWGAGFRSFFKRSCPCSPF